MYFTGFSKLSNTIQKIFPDENKDLLNKYANLERVNQELQATNESILTENKNLLKKCNNLETINQELQATNESILSENKDLQKKYTNLKIAKKDLMGKYCTVFSERDALDCKYIALKKANQLLLESNASDKKKISTKTKKIKKLTENYENLKTIFYNIKYYTVKNICSDLELTSTGKKSELIEQLINHTF